MAFNGLRGKRIGAIEEEFPIASLKNQKRVVLSK
jgi:hypothetical protein